MNGVVSFPLGKVIIIRMFFIYRGASSFGSGSKCIAVCGFYGTRLCQ